MGQTKPVDEAAVAQAYRDGAGFRDIQQQFHIGIGRIQEILAAARVPARSTGFKRGNKCAAKRWNGGKAAAKTNGAKSQAVGIGDPDVLALMRRFAPVCHAKIVDPRAPADLWIVGGRRMPEAEMRRLARGDLFGGL